MSTKVGQVYFSREKRPLFLETGLQSTGEYSEATSEVIDGEIKEIIDEQYAKAVEILRGKREILDSGAEILLQREKIDGQELKDLMADKGQSG